MQRKPRTTTTEIQPCKLLIPCVWQIQSYSPSLGNQFVPKWNHCSSSYPLWVWLVGVIKAVDTACQRMFTNQAFAMGNDGEVLLYRVPWRPWRWGDMVLERNRTAINKGGKFFLASNRKPLVLQKLGISEGNIYFISMFFGGKGIYPNGSNWYPPWN